MSFYKPQGNLNEHPGYTAVLPGDLHIAEIVTHLQKSPQWKHMLIVVTYDEYGGFWDHVAPPKADRWGPGVRVPAIIISPYAKRGYVDHTQYDTTSIVRFLTHRFNLPMLPGLEARDAALKANRSKPMVILLRPSVFHLVKPPGLHREGRRRPRIQEIKKRGSTPKNPHPIRGCLCLPSGTKLGTKRIYLIT